MIDSLLRTCHICRHWWKKRNGRPECRRCPECGSHRWRDGRDHRMHVQDSEIGLIARVMHSEVARIQANSHRHVLPANPR